MFTSFKCFFIGFDLSSQLNFRFAGALEKTTNSSSSFRLRIILSGRVVV